MTAAEGNGQLNETDSPPCCKMLSSVKCRSLQRVLQAAYEPEKLSITEVENKNVLSNVDEVDEVKNNLLISEVDSASCRKTSSAKHRAAVESIRLHMRQRNSILQKQILKSNAKR